MEWTIERLQELRAEHASGMSRLAEIERHGAGVRDQLLRIEGAIKVLEEQLAAAPPLAGSDGRVAGPVAAADGD